VDFVAKDFKCGEMECPPFLNAFKKSSVEVWEPYHTDLERVASRTLDKTQRAIGNYNFIIAEQSIITLVFCHYITYIKRNAKLTLNAIDYGSK
jgi:hypothetical protein